MDFFFQMQEILEFAKRRYGKDANISVSENPGRLSKKYTIAIGSNGIYMSWSGGTLEEVWNQGFKEALSYNREQTTNDATHS